MATRSCPFLRSQPGGGITVAEDVARADPPPNHVWFAWTRLVTDAWRSSGLGDDGFADWLIDRVARRPSGSRARRVYGSDDVHDFARRAILDALALGPDDRLLDLGCGGGLLLRDAFATGASATGRLTTADVTAFLARECPKRSVGGARDLVSCLRPLFRYLQRLAPQPGQTSSSASPSTRGGSASSRT